MKVKTHDKYLGDILHQGGCAASVRATVMDREGKAKAAMFEAAAIVDEFRSQFIGGFLIYLVQPTYLLIDSYRRLEAENLILSPRL